MKAKGKGQKAKGKSAAGFAGSYFCLLLFAFCLLPWSF
jgi:hypothetical protein